MKRLLIFSAAALVAAALSGCGLVSNAFNCWQNSANHTNDLTCK